MEGQNKMTNIFNRIRKINNANHALAQLSPYNAREKEGDG